MFLLNSQIPLVRFSSELIDFFLRQTNGSTNHYAKSPQELLQAAYKDKTNVNQTRRMDQSSEPILFPKIRI